MGKPHKVVWSEGMFLNPHHFQQSDRYFEHIAVERTRCLLPFTYGLNEISINEEAVQNGLFSLDSGKGIMPDGTLISFPDSDPIPPGRRFDDFFGPSVDHVEVFIAVPLYKQDSVICDLEGREDSKFIRYKKDDIKVLDQNTATNEQTLPVARKNLRVLFSGEPDDDFSTMRIARINRSAEGFSLDENYIPPLLNIGASRPLLKIIRRVLEKLSARSRELSDKRRQRSSDMADIGPSDLSNFIFLQTVNSFIPVLNHVYRQGVGHPERLYLALSQLAGELAAFSMEDDPRKLPDYDHADLTGTFEEIGSKILALIGVVVSTKNFVIIPLERMTENIFSGNIGDETLFTKGRFFLALGGGDISQAEIIQQAPAKIKISSADNIQELLNSAMPGITLDHLPIPPSSLPVKVGYEYFKMETSHFLWEHVRLSKKIAVYVPKDLVGLDLKLIVLKG